MLRYFQDRAICNFVKYEIAAHFSILSSILSSSSVSLEVRDIDRPVPGYPFSSNECAVLLRYTQERIPRFREFDENGRFSIGEMVSEISKSRIQVFAWVENWVLVGIWLASSEKATFPKSLKGFVRIEQNVQEYSKSRSIASTRIGDIPPTIQKAADAMRIAIKDGKVDTFNGYRLSVPSSESRIEHAGATFYVIGEDDEGNCLVMSPDSSKIQEVRHSSKCCRAVEITFDELIRKGSSHAEGAEGVR